MKTLGRMFEGRPERSRDAADWSGKVVLTDEFLKALGEAYRAHKAKKRPQSLVLTVDGFQRSEGARAWLDLEITVPEIAAEPDAAQNAQQGRGEAA